MGRCSCESEWMKVQSCCSWLLLPSQNWCPNRTDPAFQPSSISSGHFATVKRACGDFTEGASVHLSSCAKRQGSGFEEETGFHDSCANAYPGRRNNSGHQFGLVPLGTSSPPFQSLSAVSRKSLLRLTALVLRTPSTKISCFCPADQIGEMGKSQSARVHCASTWARKIVQRRSLKNTPPCLCKDWDTPRRAFWGGRNIPAALRNGALGQSTIPTRPPTCPPNQRPTQRTQISVHNRPYYPHL